MYYWFIVNDSNGAIGANEGTQKPDTTLAPSGFSLVGPYNDSTNKMNTTTQAAYDEPQAYLYQNGAFVNNSTWAALQLSQAKQKQSALVTNGYNATLVGGFKSNTTGHTYATDSLSSARIAAKATQLLQDTTITSIPWMTKDAGEVTHTRTEFLGVFDDGIAWERAQYTQKETMVTSTIPNATTVSAVQAIIWSEASY